MSRESCTNCTKCWFICANLAAVRRALGHNDCMLCADAATASPHPQNCPHPPSTDALSFTGPWVPLGSTEVLCPCWSARPVTPRSPRAMPTVRAAARVAWRCSRPASCRSLTAGPGSRSQTRARPGARAQVPGRPPARPRRVRRGLRGPGRGSPASARGEGPARRLPWSPATLARFKQEARAIARLNHPNTLADPFRRRGRRARLLRDAVLRGAHAGRSASDGRGVAVPSRAGHRGADPRDPAARP